MSKALKQHIWLFLGLALCLALCACSGSTISEDPSEWRPTIGNCWVCAIYGTSFQVSNDIVFSATEISIPLARMVLGIGLLFLLLFRVGSMMLFKDTKAMGNTLKETGFVFLKAGFVALLIYDADTFLTLVRDYFIYPLGEFFMMMANAVLDCVPGAGQYFSGIQGLTPDANGVVVDLSGRIAPIDPNRTIFGDLGVQVQYTVSRIFVSLKTGIPLVLQMVANGGMVAWILGIVAGWQMFGLMVMFPLAFVDGFIMLAFYVIFLPFCIVLWVFPATKSYIGKIIPNLIAPFYQILFGCIVVVLMITMIQVYADMGLNGMLRESAQDSNAWVVESAAAARPPMIIMVMLLISVKKIAAEIGDFANLFTGVKTDATLFGLIDKVKSIMKKVAEITAEVALAAATGGASAAGSAARHAAKEAAKAAAKAAVEAAKEGATGAGKEITGGNDSGGEA